MSQFDIDRLKKVKLIGRHGIFPTTRIKRNDLMDKFKREAWRVLDRGRDLGGVKRRQTQSSHFNDDEWVNSFVAIRISEIPKKVVKDKMTNKIRYLIGQNNPTAQWEAILLMESRYHTDNSYRYPAYLLDIEETANRYWEMVELV